MKQERRTGEGLLRDLLLSFGLIDEEKLEPGKTVSLSLSREIQICEHVISLVVVSLVSHFGVGT